MSSSFRSSLKGQYIYSIRLFCSQILFDKKWSQRNKQKISSTIHVVIKKTKKKINKLWLWYVSTVLDVVFFSSLMLIDFIDK